LNREYVGAFFTLGTDVHDQVFRDIAGIVRFPGLKLRVIRAMHAVDDGFHDDLTAEAVMPVLPDVDMNV
jgi:hypothetical protein